MQKYAKETVKEYDLFYNTAMTKYQHFLRLQHRFPRDTGHQLHIFFLISMYIPGINGVLYHGVIYKIISVLVDYIVEK